jgi:hypothetical protein
MTEHLIGQSKWQKKIAFSKFASPAAKAIMQTNGFETP